METLSVLLVFLGWIYRWPVISQWRHNIETICALLALCEETPPVIGEFPSPKGQWCFDVLCCSPSHSVEQTVELLMVWNTTRWCDSNSRDPAARCWPRVRSGKCDSSVKYTQYPKTNVLRFNRGASGQKFLLSTTSTTNLPLFQIYLVQWKSLKTKLTVNATDRTPRCLSMNKLHGLML